MTAPPWSCECETSDGMHSATCPNAPVRCAFCQRLTILADTTDCEGFNTAYHLVGERICDDCRHLWTQVHCEDCGCLLPLELAAGSSERCHECAERETARHQRKVARARERREAMRGVA